MAVKWRRTNENLFSITAGLNAGPADSVLAVGGSGDQAFALIGCAEKVVAADISQDQADYISQQAKSLAKGDYKEFFRRRFESGLQTLKELLYVETVCGTNYFGIEQLENMQQRIAGFSVVKADVIDMCRNGFNRIYLSNALNGNDDELREKLVRVCCSLPKNGLVYASNGEALRDAIGGSGLVIDDFLSFLSKDSNWHPVVLRKI